MRWYVFDMTGFSEPLHLSLSRAFMRQSRREDQSGESRLYAARVDHEAVPAFYYLQTPDERTFTRMIRQFGGRRSNPPSSARLQEIKKEDDFKTPAPGVDSAPC